MADVALTELIHRAQQGDAAAADALFSEVYPQLRQLARARLRAGGRNVALDTGVLINESYLRFASGGRLHLEDRVHFMRWTARVMRSVIVDFARKAMADRRGGGVSHVALTTTLGAAGRSSEEDIIRVHEALEQLAQVDGRLAQVVEMRYFAGMSDVEIAQALNLTDRTVRRDWEKARLLLRDML